MVIEQVLQKDYLITDPDEEKLPSQDIKVAQKVFLERRTDHNDDNVGSGDLVTLDNIDKHDLSPHENYTLQQQCHQNTWVNKIILYLQYLGIVLLLSILFCLEFFVYMLINHLWQFRLYVF